MDRLTDLYGRSLDYGQAVRNYLNDADLLVLHAMEPERRGNIAYGARHVKHNPILYDPRYIEGGRKREYRRMGRSLVRTRQYVPICLDRDTGEIRNAMVDEYGNIVPIDMSCGEPLFIVENSPFGGSKYKRPIDFRLSGSVQGGLVILDVQQFPEGILDMGKYIELEMSVIGTKVYLTYTNNHSIVKLDEAGGIILNPVVRPEPEWWKSGNGLSGKRKKRKSKKISRHK